MSQQCSWPTHSWPLEGRCPYYALLGLTQAPGFAGGHDYIAVFWWYAKKPMRSVPCLEVSASAFFERAVRVAMSHAFSQNQWWLPLDRSIASKGRSFGKFCFIEILCGSFILQLSKQRQYLHRTHEYPLLYPWSMAVYTRHIGKVNVLYTRQNYWLHVYYT